MSHNSGRAVSTRPSDGPFRMGGGEEPVSFVIRVAVAQAEAATSGVCHTQPCWLCRPRSVSNRQRFRLTVFNRNGLPTDASLTVSGPAIRTGLTRDSSQDVDEFWQCRVGELVLWPVVQTEWK
ncbi:MAG: hypothetical protein O2945_18665 [Planctomycetota bacterium]|nr:hypothetical protein [Planctomycetota bacterium]MDA0921096.1 hypothetical protein [Planctomycetota bacterium]